MSQNVKANEQKSKNKYLDYKNTKGNNMLQMQYNVDSTEYRSHYRRMVTVPKELVFDNIDSENRYYDLTEPINCTVNYEEENFILRSDKLDITVWGDSLAEANEAFAFAFESNYECYALEDDSKLSIEAIEIKQMMLNLVKSVMRYEPEENLRHLSRTLA